MRTFEMNSLLKSRNVSLLHESGEIHFALIILPASINKPHKNS